MTMTPGMMTEHVEVPDRVVDVLYMVGHRSEISGTMDSFKLWVRAPSFPPGPKLHQTCKTTPSPFSTA